MRAAYWPKAPWRMCRRMKESSKCIWAARASPAGIAKTRTRFPRRTGFSREDFVSGAGDVLAVNALSRLKPVLRDRGERDSENIFMLQVEKLHQYYGGSHILRGLSFDVKVGEVTCLLGRNGVGKTTLLKVLMGLLPAKEGAVQWEGKAITGFKPHQRVHAGIAYVPQGREIFGRLTVEENLLMGLSRFPGSEAKEVPAFIYELFPVLLQMKHRRGGDLSGGQQQQLAIGRALASRPRLLILDEPTEGIQPSVIKEIGVVIKKLAERGDMAILLVEQFYDFAAELADQYLVMSRGEIVQQGRGENMEAEGVRGLVTI
ncbi:Branched-chain amino acid ABC transporter ATP-binding protein [Pseudomonas savastanoi pv. glycinea]|nr:Branched-chain amino acid ABC transporter ATP-binding protein [Pseudomonas savastanoi pv. glycinea]